MPNKTDTGGQPTMEKLEAEGVSPRRCISYEGLGEYNGTSGGNPNQSRARPAPALSSFGPARKGGRGY